MANPTEDIFGRLEGLDEFKRLTPTQKSIVVEHHKNPSASKTELAKIVGCQWNTVHALFYSESFEKVNQELAIQGVRELISKAIRTLDDCLNSSNDSVRFAAATKILHDAGILKTPEPTKAIKQDNKIMVVWNDSKINPLEAMANAGLVHKLQPPS